MEQFYTAFCDELKLKLGPSYNWNCDSDGSVARITIFKRTRPNSGRQTYLALMVIRGNELTVIRATAGVDYIISLNNPDLFDIIIDELTGIERLNDVREHCERKQSEL